MQNIDDIVRGFKVSDVKNLRIGIDDFIEKFNADEVVLVDVRQKFETDLWGLKFALEIPYQELPDKLYKLPSDKLIVVACPNEYRSNMAKEYLRFKGFKVANLEGGINALTHRLKGGGAKDLKI